MAHTDPKKEALKQVLRETLAGSRYEQRRLRHEIFAKVLEDFALAEAMREGRQSERVERDEVFGTLELRA